MNRACVAVLLALVSAYQNTDPAIFRGRLNDRPIAEAMTQFELRRSKDRHLPGVGDADRVFTANIPQFRPAGAPDGLPVAFVETKSGEFLLVDVNLDGRFSESERTPYTPAEEFAESRELAFDLTLNTEGPVLPFKCRLTTELWEGERRHYLHFTASFRVEGYADIRGRRTLMSLPFSPETGRVATRFGKIGIDANGDGQVDLRGLNGPEVTFAKGDQVIFPVAGTYVSVESADFSTRALVLREHRAEEYTVIDIRAGKPVPDFGFTDFSGRERKLSEFRGKYVLLDFWGSWCAPCLADIPALKAAYDRFRGRRFEILGINYEYDAPPERVRALLAEKAIPWPNATSQSVKDLVDKRFRIWGFPAFILLDPDGVVVETNGPALRPQALPLTLDRILPAR